MSGQTPRASPRPAPLPPRTPQPPAPRSHLELISQGKQELQALSSENDSMLQSCKGVQELIGKLAASRTALKEELDAAHTALEHEEEQRLAADQKLRLLEVSGSSLEELLQQGEATRTALETQLNKQGELLQQTQEQLRESQLQTAAAATKLTEAEGAITALRVELETMRQSSAALQQTCMELQERVKQSEGKACLLDDIYHQREALEKQVAELQRVSLEAKNEVAQQGAYIQELQGQLREKDAALLAADSQVTQQSAMAGDMDDLQWRAEAAEMANATLQAQVKERLQAMEARIKKAEARAADKEQESDKLRRALEQSKEQSGTLRRENEGLMLRIEKAEARMNEEALARKKEAKRAKQAEEKAKRLDHEVKEMKSNLQAAKDGMGMMRTIAKIRNLDDGELPVGFDAVGERTLDAQGKGKAPRKGRRSLR